MTRCFWLMPRPVEALPCGSRSISSTRFSAAASAVARLMAVVVLPTPPFWLTTAKTRGGLGMDLPAPAMPIASLLPLTSRRLHFEDHARRIGAARPLRDTHVPGFTGFGQFIGLTRAFEKYALACGFQEANCMVQQLGERRKRPCGHHVGRDR